MAKAKCWHESRFDHNCDLHENHEGAHHCGKCGENWVSPGFGAGVHPAVPLTKRNEIDGGTE